MLYSCTQMGAVGVKAINNVCKAETFAGDAFNGAGAVPRLLITALTQQTFLGVYRYSQHTRHVDDGHS